MNGITQEEIDRAATALGTTRDALAETLKEGHEHIIKAGEWRPLAQHVIALVALALKGTIPNPHEMDDFYEETLEEIQKECRGCYGKGKISVCGLCEEGVDHSNCDDSFEITCDACQGTGRIA